MQEDLAKPAGFWARSTAGLIDLAGVGAFIVLAAEVLALLGTYVPIELGAIIVYAAYTAVAVAWRRQTLGGWLCGLQVMRRDGGKVGLARSAVRALAVTAAQCMLGLPFLAVTVSKSKRGLHDRFAGTCVALSQRRHHRRCWAAAVVWAVVVGWLGAQVFSGWRLYADYASWRADARAASKGTTDSAVPPVEVSSLGEPQQRAMAAWLADHGQDPADCVTGLAARHRVTMIGEAHGEKEILAFVNQVIPRLYHEAGVRAIALECCPSDMDGELARMVTDQRFDHDLAKRIARRAPWPNWGWQGYWDVLETVWKLNRSLSAQQQPLQVVGIFPRIDLPSLRLVKEGPWMEKLRILRVLDDLPAVPFHDAHYANHVESPAFKDGRRTIVLVGEAHAALRNSRQSWHRMGSMLHGRYGDQVAHVVLHSGYSRGEIPEWIEKCAEQDSDGRIAFLVADSPFASLHDDAAYAYSGDPNLRLADLVSAYVVLAPQNALQPCEWMDGYVTRYMFGRHKPMYELAVGRKLADHHEANQYMSKGMRF